MKKAFIVMAHQKPHQLNRFLEQILNESAQNDVFVHVNKKYESIINDIVIKDRIYISKERLPISWGRDDFLKAILLMYRCVLSSEKQYDYIIVCSGQDLLVRKGLDDFLNEHNGEMFIECDGLNLQENDRFRRATLLHKFPNILRNKYDFKFHPLKVFRSILLRFYQRHPRIFLKRIDYKTDNILFYYDKFWHMIPIELAGFIIDFLNSNPGFWSIYDGGFVTDESFFSTVIMNSKYKNRIHFTDGFSKSYTYISGITNGHPQIITMKDIDLITESNCFLARKFDENVDSNVINYYCDMFYRSVEKL